MLITHLYEFFGVLLGCTMIGKPGYPAYGGDTNMYNVHKNMDLNPAQLGYFITQVGLSAASFGVADADVTAVGMALNKLFGYRCAAPTAVIPGASPEPQSICQDLTCPIAPNATCPANATATAPAPASGKASGTATSTAKPTNEATLKAASSVLGIAALFVVGMAM
jgi:hypothetical protein